MHTIEILAERARELRTLQREVDERFQETELVARVVPDAIDLHSIDWPLLEELAQLTQRYGFTGEIAELDLNTLGDLLAQGIFSIVHLNRIYFSKPFPLSRSYTRANAIIHAVVPTHLASTFVTFNDPLPPGKRRRASRRKFEAAQRDMNRWCVVCRPV